MIGFNGEKSDTNERSEHDFYQTPESFTIALFKHVTELRGKIIWECACGDGAITNVAGKYGPVVNTDYRQTMLPGMTVMDFETCHKPMGVNAIVTNPPFNRSKMFIRRAHYHNVPFAFLLKSSYWFTESHRALWMDIPPSMVLPLTWRESMAPERGNSPPMTFQWCVWGIKRADYTYTYPLVRPK